MYIDVYRLNIAGERRLLRRSLRSPGAMAG